MARVLVISNDVIGRTMAGPGIRYVALARELSKDHAVALAAPEPSEQIDKDLFLTTYRTSHPKDLLPLLAKARVVIAQSLHPTLLKEVRRLGIRYIVDLYDPIVLENLEAQRDTELADQEANHQFYLDMMVDQLACADHILCASERQRDYWLGNLTAIGRLTPELYRRDPSLESLISLLPFGYEAKKPRVTQASAINEVIPHFHPLKDKLIIWGGGVWNWFDPLSLIKAVDILAARRNDIKLLFLGTKHPNPQMPQMQMVNEAHDLATKLKLKDTSVFFREGWLPYEELANFMMPATIGVSTHFEHAETRFSFRTRILTYIWARLPILATRGDAMADLIEREGLGLTVDYQDPAGIAQAIERLCDDTKFKAQIAENFQRIWPQFTWPELIAPLSAKIKADTFAGQTLRGVDFSALQRRYLISGFWKVWQQKGLRGIIAKLRRR